MCKTPIKKGDILKIYTDGAAGSYPGPGACAFIFVKGEDVIYSDSKNLGTSHASEVFSLYINHSSSFFDWGSISYLVKWYSS